MTTLDIDKCHTIRVWWCKEWQSWGVSWQDAEGNQLGDSEWYHLKRDAVDMARAYRDSDRCHNLVIQTRAA